MNESKFVFTGKANDYVQGRPTYPNAAIDLICLTAQLKPTNLVVDMGSGTGIASRIFAERGYKVIGIEPNTDMRLQAQAVKGQGAPIEYRWATAEETGLSSQSVDLIVSAQSFHWFDTAKALTEFKRLLKPTGWVTIIFNQTDGTDPFSREILTHLPEIERLHQRANVLTLQFLSSNLFQHHQTRTFRHDQEVNEEQFVHRALSAYSAPLGEAERAELRAKMINVFQQYQVGGVGGKARIIYQTRLCMAEQAPG